MHRDRCKENEKRWATRGELELHELNEDNVFGISARRVQFALQKNKPAQIY
jgi:hypothetical protein